MKNTWKLAVTAILLGGALSASAATWPESCGKEDIQFKVKTDKKNHTLTAPEAGMAQIVFIESLKGSFFVPPTVRLGIDGAWASADRGTSYATVSVTPGDHRLCGSRQSSTNGEKENVGVVTVHAEAGKVYFYELKVIRTEIGGPELLGSDPMRSAQQGSTLKPKPTIDSVEFTQLNESEGRDLVKVSGLSTAATK